MSALAWEGAAYALPEACHDPRGIQQAQQQRPTVGKHQAVYLQTKVCVTGEDLDGKQQGLTAQCRDWAVPVRGHGFRGPVCSLLDAATLIHACLMMLVQGRGCKAMTWPSPGCGRGQSQLHMLSRPKPSSPAITLPKHAMMGSPMLASVASDVLQPLRTGCTPPPDVLLPRFPLDSVLCCAPCLGLWGAAPEAGAWGCSR